MQRRPGENSHPRAQPVRDLEAHTQVAVVGRGARPALPDARQKAHLGRGVLKLARNKMGGDEVPVEVGALVFPP